MTTEPSLEESGFLKPGYRFPLAPTENPPALGDLRLTTVLESTGIGGSDGYTLLERLHLSPNIVAAPLTLEEIERLQSAGIANPGIRLEVFGREGDGNFLHRQSSHCIRLISLFVRMAPRPGSIVLHRYNANGVWEHRDWFGTTHQQLGARDGHNYIPTDRARTTWPSLLEHFPATPPQRTDSIYRALDMYFDSVAEARDGNWSKSLLSSAVAFELLLGPGIRDELRYRMSTRGGLLVAQGSDAYRIAKWLGKYYDVRSALVHAGQAPTREVVDAIHQYLMRAIPSMFQLAVLTGGHAQAAVALDMAAFGERRELDVLMAGGWWSYVDSSWLAHQLSNVSTK